mmetsp:Transcript_4486/g.10575  ORF Transcript_4486/g.10575 Transcript_4486/m.10575 type:complete len:199 (+) Transcript_4486:89-685(+)
MLEKLLIELKNIEKDLHKLDSKAHAERCGGIERVLRDLKRSIKEDDDWDPILGKMLASNYLKSLIFHLPYLSTRGKQDVRSFWLKALKSSNLKKNTENHLRENPEILIMLMRGISCRESFCGEIMRTCLKLKSVHFLVLNSPLIWQLFQFVEASDFELSSDGFKIFQALMNRKNAEEKKYTFDFLMKNFEKAPLLLIT